MDNDFDELVYKRCERAVLSDDMYNELTKKIIAAQKTNNDILDDLMNRQEARAEVVCYRKGFNDAMKIILKGLA